MAPSGASGSPSAEGVDSDPARVRYLAFLLDDVSRCSLLDWVAELSGGHPGADDDGWTVHADHVTVAHRDASGFDAALASFPWGMACEMRVLGIAGDARARAVHVEVPDFVPHPAAEVPHVTVACAPDARAVESGAMLVEAIASGAYLATSEAAPLTLTGRLGGVTVADVRVFQPPAPRDRDEAVSEAPSSEARRDVRPTSERERVAHLWRQLDALATTTDDDDDSNRGWLSAGAPGGYLTVARRLDASRDPVPANLPVARVRRTATRFEPSRFEPSPNGTRGARRCRRGGRRRASRVGRVGGDVPGRVARRARDDARRVRLGREPSRRGFALRRGRGGLLRAGTRR